MVGLTVATGCDNPIFAPQRKLLRDRSVARSGQSYELANGFFTVGQVAKDCEAAPPG
jgi:hypothetical protein